MPRTADQALQSAAHMRFLDSRRDTVVGFSALSMADQVGILNCKTRYTHPHSSQASEHQAGGDGEVAVNPTIPGAAVLRRHASTVHTGDEEAGVSTSESEMEGRQWPEHENDFWEARERDGLFVRMYRPISGPAHSSKNRSCLSKMLEQEFEGTGRSTYAPVASRITAPSDESRKKALFNFARATPPIPTAVQSMGLQDVSVLDELCLHCGKLFPGKEALKLHCHQVKKTECAAGILVGCFECDAFVYGRSPDRERGMEHVRRTEEDGVEMERIARRGGEM